MAGCRDSARSRKGEIGVSGDRLDRQLSDVNANGNDRSLAEIAPARQELSLAIEALAEEVSGQLDVESEKPASGIGSLVRGAPDVRMRFSAASTA